MVNRIIEWSLNNRFIVLLLCAVIIGSGLISASKLPLDAVPDLTNVQVQILTTSPALGPVEVEQFIELTSLEPLIARNLFIKLRPK